MTSQKYNQPSPPAAAKPLCLFWLPRLLRFSSIALPSIAATPSSARSSRCVTLRGVGQHDRSGCTSARVSLQRVRRPSDTSHACPQTFRHLQTCPQFIELSRDSRDSPFQEKEEQEKEQEKEEQEKA
eukprot:COSAG03_NODE_12057_length_563_cov_1.368534_1_plen_127_part_00